MLPSRGLKRSLGPLGARGNVFSHVSKSRSLSTKVALGRRFEASQRRTASGILASASISRTSTVAAPITLGGLSASRSFSLWSPFKKSSPEEAAQPAQATTTTTTTTPVESAFTPTAEKTEVAADAATAGDVNAVPSEVDTSAVSDLVNNADILNMPEQLGYLHAMGLDFGWGPTSVMQWVLEHVHIWTGLPWGASIVVTTVLLRTIMFYPQIKSMQWSSAMGKAQQSPTFQEAKKIYSQGYVNRDSAMIQQGSFMMQMAQKEAGVNKLGMGWGFASIPFTYGLFRLLSNMAAIPVPSMETGGYLWFTDLTVKDPYFLLPVAATSLMFMSIWIGNRQATAQQKAMIKKFAVPIGALGLGFSTFFSAAFNLAGVATAASAILSSSILALPAVRRKFNLPIVNNTTNAAPAPGPAVAAATAAQPPPASAEYQAPRAPGATGFAGLRQKFSDNINQLKTEATKKMESSSGTFGASPADQKARGKKDKLRQSEEKRRDQEREEFERKYGRR